MERAFVQPVNWQPFMPEGLGGVMKGVSAICFAYIGFDAISTTAEECKDPQRDIPKAMMWSLGICTVLYVAIALVLTGMVNYKELAVGDPLAFVFSKVNKNFIAGVVSVGAVIATTSAILVYQLGQPRIWMVMSRDGLLPKKFSSIHPKYKTPWFATIITGFAVGIPALFMNLTELTDLTSIGTLFAFALVCGGILVMDSRNDDSQKPKFKVPFISAKYIGPISFLAGIYIIHSFIPTFFSNLLSDISQTADNEKFGNGLVMAGFFLIWLAVTILSYLKNLSLIPVLGLLINLYLMTQLGIHNWYRFFYWCLIGFIIYFIYSYRKSKLA